MKSCPPVEPGGPVSSPSILVIGDTHSQWAYLTSLLLYYRPDICIVAGDFGWWPGQEALPHEALPREALERTQIHFADGNHEDHRSLLAAAPRGRFEAEEIAPGIIYHPRGSTMELPDGRTVFFAGGAKSVDRRWRQEGRTWFREELLLRKHLPDRLPHADVVISHTVPDKFGIDKFADFVWIDPRLDTSPDVSQATLDAVLKECAPGLWLAGHFHRRMDGNCGGTEYHVLDMLSGGACRPEGLPSTFWLSGGPGVRRDMPGWALPGGAFIPQVEKNSLYACADMSALPPALFRLFDKRRRMYRTRTVRETKGIVLREADSFLKTLCRFRWRPEAAMGDRIKDEA